MNILFEDEHLICIEKEVGLESEKQVPALLEELCHRKVYTLHRLDKNVGGIMLYAKDSKTAAKYSKYIQEGLLVKEYVAMVEGTLESSGEMTDYLYKDRTKNKVYVVKKLRKGVKEAKLTYDVIKSGPTSLVHIRLYTGRSHQIRVQFASRKHPLIGDHKYGSKDQRTSPMLYSCRLTFPYKGTTKTIESYPKWAK